MKRFRFSLLGLLLTISAVAIFFGYAQWSRLHIRQEYEALKTEGVHFSEFDDSWWVTHPRVSVVVFTVDKPGVLVHNGKSYTVEEARTCYLNWEARVQSMGVGRLGLGLIQQGGRESLIVIDDLDEYAK